MRFSIGIGRGMWVGGPGLGKRLMAKPGPGDINIILKVTKKNLLLSFTAIKLLVQYTSIESVLTLCICSMCHNA